MAELSNENGGSMQRNILVHDDTIWAQNEDGTWSESIPLPYMGLRKVCWFCGAKFFRTKSYQDHYRCNHTDGLAYIRKPEGFLTSYRICRGIDKPLPESLIYRPNQPTKANKEIDNE